MRITHNPCTQQHHRSQPGVSPGSPFPTHASCHFALLLTNGRASRRWERTDWEQPLKRLLCRGLLMERAAGGWRIIPCVPPEADYRRGTVRIHGRCRGFQTLATLSKQPQGQGLLLGTRGSSVFTTPPCSAFRLVSVGFWVCCSCCQCIKGLKAKFLDPREEALPVHPEVFSWDMLLASL